MKRRALMQRLEEMDRRGVWAFTPATFSSLADHRVLIRAARGVYVNPYARSMPSEVRRGLIRFLRRREVSYISLEYKLSEASVICQVATVLTCMTTGSPGRFDTPWGTIEFTHTDRHIAVGTDVHAADDGVLEATVERA